MNNKFIFFLLFSLLIQINFVFGEENYTDYGKDFNLNYELKGYQINIGSLIETRNTFINFKSDISKVIVNGEVFENIEKTEPAGSLEISKTGDIVKAKFLVNKDGGYYTLGDSKFYAPPGSLVEFDKENGKLSVIMADNSKIEKFPTSKNNNGLDVQYDGKNVKLPDDNSLSGIFNIDTKGNTFVYSNDIKKGFEINNIAIISFDKENKRISLFFDGNGHEENSISFGNKNLRLYSRDSVFGINFKEGNNYVKIDSGDHVAFKIEPKGDIQLESRGELIPKLSIIGDVVVEQDAKSISYSRGDVIISNMPFSNIVTSSVKYKTTSPMELFSLGDNELFVDNFNRFGFFSVKEFDGKEDITILNNEIPTTFSRRISYNYPDEEEVSKLVGKPIIFYDVESGNRDLVLGRLRDYISSVPVDERNSLGNLRFIGNSQFDNIYDKKYDAIMFPGTGDIIFRANSLFGSEQFDHEFGHLTHFNYRKMQINQNSKLSEEFKDINDGLKEVGEEVSKIEKQIVDLSRYSVTAPPSEARKVMDDIDALNNKLKSSIAKQGELMMAYNNVINGKLEVENEWKKIAGPYGIEPKTNVWESEGFLTPQARQSIEEDIASFFQKSENPRFFKNLLDSKNPDSGIYRKKLELAYKMGLPKSRYEAILREAGL